MRTHDQVVKKLMRRPGVRAEVERLEREESALLDALLKARQEAGLTQAQVALTARLSKRVIDYDNERGKGDHRHAGNREKSYRFSSVETLIADFLSDVKKERGAR